MAIDVRDEAAPRPVRGAPDGRRETEIEGERYRRRNPVGALLLVAATLGVYAVVWQYKVNDEARRFLRDNSITPALSALAVMIGLSAPLPLLVAVVLALAGVDVAAVWWLASVSALLLIPIPLMLSVYRTGGRIDRMRAKAGLEPSEYGLVAVLVSPAMLHIPLFQSDLNEIWGPAPSLPGVGLAKGLLVTLKHLLSRSVTQQYPREKPDLPARTRGVIALKQENCTVCWKCAKWCPDWCIYIESHKETHEPASGGRARSAKVLDRFAIDFALCMYCGICVEVCPFDALFWSPEFEYAEYDVLELIHEKDKLQDWTYKVKPPPELEEGATPPEEAPMAAVAAAPQTEAAAPPAAPAEAPAEAPAAAPAEAPAAAQKPPAAAPREKEPEVEPDQETYERVLQEQLDAGANPRVAEGRAKAAALRAARKQAREGGG